MEEKRIELPQDVPLQRLMSAWRKCPRGDMAKYLNDHYFMRLEHHPHGEYPELCFVRNDYRLSLGLNLTARSPYAYLRIKEGPLCEYHTVGLLEAGYHVYSSRFANISNASTSSDEQDERCEDTRCSVCYNNVTAAAIRR